ncbi:MAG: DUF2804 domain-containing protein [Burkholderiales bacterium]|nr:DUF2804 domain-containing protein [Burkholderiales bacterium]
MDRFAADLPQAPLAVVDTEGRPLAGRFAGRCAQIDWAALRGEWARSAWYRHFHHKRWQYVGIAAGRCFIGCAVVDVGWTNMAFAYVFDLERKSVVGSVSCDGLPGLTAQLADVPAAGAESKFRLFGARIVFSETEPGQFRLQVRGPGGLAIDAELDGTSAAPWLFASNRVEGGTWHATHKSPSLVTRGVAHADGETYSLDGAHSGLDHSNGLLARDTRWLWASAHGQGMGFNLQSGYFGDNENALWLDGRLIPLGAAQFEFDPNHTASPWRMRTEDQLLDLQFVPVGERREDRNLIVAASRYVQPVGHYTGWVRASATDVPRPVSGLLGVAEHHESRW